MVGHQGIIEQKGPREAQVCWQVVLGATTCPFDWMHNLQVVHAPARGCALAPR